MEQKNPMDDDDFEQLLTEIRRGLEGVENVGRKGAGQGGNNDYLIRKEVRVSNEKEYQLTFPEGSLTPDQQKTLAEVLVNNVLQNPSNDPNSSILELADLPENCKFDSGCFEKLKNDTIALNTSTEKAELIKANKQFNFSMMSGLFLGGLAMIPAPVVGGLMIYLGLSAVYPPLLIASTVVLGVAALAMLGVAAYSKWQETKARKTFTGSTSYEEVEESRDSLRDSLLGKTAGKGLKVEKGGEKTSTSDLTSSYREGNVLNQGDVEGQGLEEENKGTKSTITKTL